MVPVETLCIMAPSCLGKDQQTPKHDTPKHQVVNTILVNYGQEAAIARGSRKSVPFRP